MSHTAFDIFHPAISGFFFVAVLGLSMTAFEPVLVVISFVSALTYSALLRGIRATAHTLTWQLPLVILIAIINPFFSASGSTEIFRIDVHAIYLESLIYGLCMGLLLVSILLWFSNAAHILTSDKIMALTGKRLPTLGLMISMINRLIPRLVRQGKRIEDAHAACTSACAPYGSSQNAISSRDKTMGLSLKTRSLSQYVNHHPRLTRALRSTTMLMEWSMENSLETADAMRARGWGSTPHRSVYQLRLFRLHDAIAIAILIVMASAAGISAWITVSQFSFYPLLTSNATVHLYGPYALFCFLPCFLEGWEALRWM